MSSNSPVLQNSEVVEKTGRLLSLDVFRGLTILGMILVNNAGDWSHRYWPFMHASWHGWTPCDLVFPFFLFIVGTALAYSLRKYRHGEQVDAKFYQRIFRRVLLLGLLGLFLDNSGPWISQWLGDGPGFRLDSMRIPGVLQRIAIVFGITSLIVLHLRLRGQAILFALLLLGYWALLFFFPVPNGPANYSAEGGLPRVVDIFVFGEKHIYSGALENNEPDPEGILSTLPSIATALLGYWTGLFIQRRPPNFGTVWRLVALGLACFLLGLLWGEVFPINKKIWTSSYVLVSGGLAILGLAFCLWLFDVLGWRRAAKPFQIVGVNAIFAFVASGLMARVLGSISVGEGSLRSWLYETLFSGPLGVGELASLGFALATVLSWWFVLWLMSLRGWSIRV